MKSKVQAATGEAGAQTDAAAADSSLKVMKAEVAAKQSSLKSLQRKLEVFNSMQVQWAWECVGVCGCGWGWVGRCMHVYRHKVAASQQN